MTKSTSELPWRSRAVDSDPANADHTSGKARRAGRGQRPPPVAVAVDNGPGPAEHGAALCYQFRRCQGQGRRVRNFPGGVRTSESMTSDFFLPMMAPRSCLLDSESQRQPSHRGRSHGCRHRCRNRGQPLRESLQPGRCRGDRETAQLFCRVVEKIPPRDVVPCRDGRVDTCHCPHESRGFILICMMVLALNTCDGSTRRCPTSSRVARRASPWREPSSVNSSARWRPPSHARNC
jgi:hypothetical protein